MPPQVVSAPTVTAFVLAGGGSLGAIQVGMLRALTNFGVMPDFVVGSSVGAINAAYFAGLPTSAGVAQLEAIWRALRRQEVFPAGALGGFLALVGCGPTSSIPRRWRACWDATCRSSAWSWPGCHVISWPPMS